MKRACQITEATGTLTLTVVFVTHIDVVDEFGVEPQEPLGEVRVYGRCVEQTKVQACLPHRSPLLQVPTHQAALTRVYEKTCVVEMM